MCSIDVGVCELVRIAEAQVDVGLRGKVEDGVDPVLAEHSFDVRGRCDVALLEGEVGTAVQDARIIQSRAVVELVERDDMIVRVRQDQVAHKPASSTRKSRQLRFRSFSKGATNATPTYMKPAPPVTRMLFALSSGSNFVLPVRTGACFQSSSVRYPLGFRMVEFLLSIAQSAWAMLYWICLAIHLIPLAPMGAQSGLSTADIMVVSMMCTVA